MVPWKAYYIFWTGIILLGKSMAMAELCDKDKDCKPHQVCCDKRCKSWPMCFLNSEKECYLDSHCVEGKSCVNNACVRKIIELGAKCENNRDCTVDVEPQDGRLVDRKWCCFGKCLHAVNCTVHLKKNLSLKTKTISTSSPLTRSCKENVNCPTGLVCLNTICTRPKNNSLSRRNKPLTQEENMSTGLLSAALFSGAVILTFACFCFIRETKYYRRMCNSQNQRRNSPTLSSCSSQHRTETIVVPNHSFNINNSQTPVTRLLFPVMFESHQFHPNDRSVIDSEHNVNPPAYLSLCQSDCPPPTYDEAMKQQT